MGLRILSFEAKNFKRLEEAQHLILDNDIIGIRGVNGAGKSTTIELFEFAFLGTVRGTDKKDLCTWGKTKGYIKVEFTYNNKPGCIVRDTQEKNGSASFTYDGIEVTGISKVNTAITELLGLDKDLAQQVVFVKQKELDKLLFDLPSVRERAYQKLCGLGDTDKIYKNLAPIVAELSTIKDLTNEINDGFNHVFTYRTKLQDKRAELSDLEARANNHCIAESDAMVKSLQELKRLIASQQVEKESVTHLTNKLGELTKDMEVLKQSLTDVTEYSAIQVDSVAKLSECNSLFSSTNSSITADKVELNKLSTDVLKPAVDKVASLEATVAALEASVPPDAADTITKLTALVNTYDLVTRTKTTLAAKQAELAAVTAEAEQLANTTVSPDAHASWVKGMDDYVSDLRNKVATASVELEQNNKLLTVLNPNSLLCVCPLCKSNISDPNSLINDLNNGIMSAKHIIATYNEAITTANTTLTSANANHANEQRLMAEAKVKVKVIVSAISELTEQLGSVVMEDLDVDTSKSMIADLTNKLNQLSIAKNELQAETNKVASTKQLITIKNNSIADKTAKASELFDELQKLLQLFDITISTSTLSTDIVTSINDVTTKVHNSKTANTKLALREGEIKSKSEELAKAKHRLETVTLTIAAYDTYDDLESELAIAEENLAIDREHHNKISVAKAEYSQIKDASKSHIAALRKLITTHKSRDKQIEVKNTITKVRDWFHYSQGPHMLVEEVLLHMTPQVNEFLSHFSMPYVVEADTENATFRCVFTDGRSIPTPPPLADTGLSGGEKVALAIAFRLAAYVMFAAKLGILFLDEPTVYLDATNVSNFSSLLVKIKDIAKSLNLQIFISTHEPSVFPYLDNVFNPNK